MRKTKRNEPCPCGSGKKYKRCCGANPNNSTNVQAMNDMLYRVHQDLISTATNKYNTILQEQLNLLDSPIIQDQETRDIYHIGLIPWIVSTLPCLANKETIFERFYRKTQSKISPLAKSILIKWPRTTPSIYEIISIDSPKKNFLQIRELWTKETFHIPFQQANNFAEGSLLIGMLIPFVQHDNFLFTMVTLFERDPKFYKDLLDKYAAKNGGINKHYPEFLAEALNSGLETHQWNCPIHEEVAALFAKRMENKNIADSIIQSGITLWNNYCEKEEPLIQKIEPYAAALEYYIQKEVLQQTTVKQIQIAQEYQTSASTLSRIYRNMLKITDVKKEE